MGGPPPPRSAVATVTDTSPLARILLIWPGPQRSSFGGISFLVEYETEAGPGRALLSPEEIAEGGILEAYGTDRLVPVPRGHGALTAGSLAFVGIGEGRQVAGSGSGNRT